MDTKSLQDEISKIVDVAGDMHVRYIVVGGCKIEAITVAGGNIRLEGGKTNTLYASESLACEAALETFKKVWEQHDRPNGMFWRCRPKMVEAIIEPGTSYYFIMMRFAFFS
jgi:hypothetical protein